MLRKDLFVRASGIGLISSMRLDGRKDIQSGKSAWSVLHSELKTRVLPLLEGNNKGPKRDPTNAPNCKSKSQVF